VKSENKNAYDSENDGSFAALIRTPRTWLILAGVVCFILLPRVGSQYVSYLVLTFFGYGVALLGLNLLFGYTGLLSFGHALFFATGAYTVSYMTAKFAILSMELSILVAVLVAAAACGPRRLRPLPPQPGRHGHFLHQRIGDGFPASQSTLCHACHCAHHV